MREQLLTLARRAVAEPERATEIATMVAKLTRRMREDEQGIEPPPGYTYAGAHTLRARVRDLVVETLPDAEGEPGIPIFTTGRSDPTPIRMPFDVWIYGVAGSAYPQMDDVEPETDFLTAALMASAEDGRVLFTVDWQLDGNTSYCTDGRQRMMVPASCIVGTRLHPRPMSWMLERNQVISVRFRSMLNAILPDGPIVRLAEVGIAFYAVNMNDP